MKLTRENLIEGLTKAIEHMKSTHESCTYYWILHKDNVNTWAIVLGWSDGFEEDSDNEFQDGTYALCAKLAYQPNNSLMQEYDIDWTMPYDEETGELNFDEAIVNSVDDAESIIDWLLAMYKGYFEEENKEIA